MVFALGRYLKEVREKLNLGVREVQEASARIAHSERNYDFYISAARLAQIENEGSTPSLFKLFSLCAIYGIGFVDTLRRMGLDPGLTWTYKSLAGLHATHPVALEVYGKDGTVTLPVRLDPSFRWDTTQLVNRMVEIWGEVPVPFLLQFNRRRHMYGFVGLGDLTLYPLLRPGSLVMIDDRRRRVVGQGWLSEFDRPIYFIELRDGYRCAWCQIEGSRLTLIPHPMSPVAAESFTFPDEAEVVGQVVGVAMRLVPPGSPSRVSAPRLPMPRASER
jgi:transcriptional regulator with XRE-family HTH domain